MKLTTLCAVFLAAILPYVSLAAHTSNWAVLVSTSRFWFNYRHMANVLSLYRTVKRLGIPDSQIILMLPDDMACNPRNTFAGSVFNDKSRGLDLYDDKGEEGMGGIEVDYRGYEVTVENFIRLLTDRWPADYPRSKRLMTDDRSNILIYMTGHGGNEFLKFQDAEEISSFDLADAFEQMWEKKRYNELLFMIDTCQANTMYSAFYTPNIIATGSSAIHQSSYSHHADQDVGVAVIDRWTYYNLEFLETHLSSTSSNVTLGQLFDSYDPVKVHSDAGIRYDLFEGGEQAARNRKVVDFFGNVQGVEVDGEQNKADSLAEWKKDLEAFSKLMERQREVMRDLNNESRLSVAPEVDRAEATVSAEKGDRVLFGSAKTVDQDYGWGKKALGAAALLALGSIWGLGNYLDK
ncbi:glycosylphosphatidylinositol anchor biosynthesis [Taxawa tesnikishii (nom. ined.)]|nr:glycosylphosphatidylinositol anchor biosynthesis [Dothideales sp. JES 119]